MSFKLLLLCLFVGFFVAFFHSANRNASVQEHRKEAKLQFHVLMLFVMVLLASTIIVARLTQCFLNLENQTLEYVLVVGQDGTDKDDLVITHVMKRSL